MFTQFLGNYLLQKGIVTQDQLFNAMARLSQTHIKLGTIAIHEGLMTANEVDECLYIQTREDKRFGEIAVSRGYLSDDQVSELLSKQTPDYILLGQNLVDDGIISYEDLERIIFEYKSDTEIYDLELDVENSELIKSIIEKFFLVAEMPANDLNVMYLELMFNSLIRFIGEDFSPLTPMIVDEYPITFGVSQAVISDHDYITHIDCDRETAIAFASRYAKEEFSEFNEYVVAALEDFLNLHNGLYIVNASNQQSKDIELAPPEITEEGVLMGINNCVDFPVAYPFGIVHLIVSY
ncbi:chemotaxis protein CheX [Pseudobutyrivibrio sp.]|uniref:chemotaxis protein CheX n=1 Tax=Pseudobutyrivibrio sp. TaxID=2014367 RepID=UPI0025DEC4ED|nr:chemotaxis protein CheX [Pseudobutyrivibrio sp.]MBR5648703.1 chemotaxis protein CheX [Pseudobutyrivibrio sp.]